MSCSWNFCFPRIMNPFSHVCPKWTLLLALVIPTTPVGFAAERPGSGDLTTWARSVVTVEVARKKYDYYQPWSRRTSQVQKTGLVIGDHQILTTADEMFD